MVKQRLESYCDQQKREKKSMQKTRIVYKGRKNRVKTLCELL